MNRIKTTFASIAMGAVALCASGAAYATTAPGEQVGLDEASPLPQGIYFIDTSRWQTIESTTGNLFETIPLVVWSTPWDILGGHLEFVAAAPVVQINIPAANCNECNGQVAPVAGAGLAWDLGGGFNFANFVIEYAPSNNRIGSLLGLNVWTFRDTAAFTYKAGTWTFLADATVNVTSNDVDTGIRVQANSFLYDLSLLKTFDKWTVGVVAYGTTDIENEIGCHCHAFFNAVGGFVGYDFGPLTLQGYVTTDYSIDNKVNVKEATELWTRVIIPLWTAPKEPMK